MSSGSRRSTRVVRRAGSAARSTAMRTICGPGSRRYCRWRPRPSARGSAAMKASARPEDVTQDRPDAGVAAHDEQRLRRGPGVLDAERHDLVPLPGGDAPTASARTRARRGRRARRPRTAGRARGSRARRPRSRVGSAIGAASARRDRRPSPSLALGGARAAASAAAPRAGSRRTRSDVGVGRPEDPLLGDDRA